MASFPGRADDRRTSAHSAPKRRDALAALLAGEYLDAATGETIAAPTRHLSITETLDGAEAELVGRLGFGKRLAVVSDVNTQAVLGRRVQRALGGSHVVDEIVLPVGVHPDDVTAEKLRQAAPMADAFVAVGSGTINDLTKYVSTLAKKPYAVFATAPSMNGYVSRTASITIEGHKSTVPAQTPIGAFFDLAVLAAAPKRMIRAGLGDSICRTTAQADWLLSHLLLGTAYRELPFDLLHDDEGDMLDQVDELIGGGLEAMQTLVRTLVLSGFGTAIVGSSAPASQAEHLVSHYIDMLAPATRPAVLHGEQIAVTTLSVARLQHAALRKRPTVQPDTTTDAELAARYGGELGKSVIDEFAPKRLHARKAEELNDRMATGWTDIRARIGAVLLPTTAIEAALRATGAPLTPAEIFLDRGFYEAALRHGREIRNRFTVLDLMATSGQLEPLLSSV